MGAHPEGANLRGADLERANLGGAVLGGADLELEGMGLGGSDLEEVSLGGARLKQKGVLGSAHLRGARADDLTRWPAGFDWQAAGVTLDRTPTNFVEQFGHPETADKAPPTTP
jgi:uncharacterized protein YjbI with pentapeptide repeats